jgi:Ca2+-binding EF-hand superfamily protein
VQLFHNSGENMQKEELKNMMQQADSSGDNSIQFDEFKELFTSKTLT